MNRLKNLEEEFAEEYILLRKSVTCSICLEVYQNPVCLPCQHGFCESCITLSLKLREKCPICLAPAKKNTLKSGTNLTETLDLFRRLLSTIEQSLKARKQTTAIQKMNIPDELHVTEHSSTCNSDLESVIATDPAPSEFVQDITSPSVLVDELQTVNYKKKRIVSSLSVCDTKATSTSSASKRGRKDTEDSSFPDTIDKRQEIKKSTITVDNKNNEEAENKSIVHPLHTNSLTMSSFLRTFHIFHKGDLVSVLPRTWSGINKLGGVGKVEHVRAVDANENTVDISRYFTTMQDRTVTVSTTLSSKELEFLASMRLYYRVKFVLDGRVEDDIPAAFLEKFEELSRERRRQNTPSSNSFQKANVTSPSVNKSSRKSLNSQSPVVSNIIQFATAAATTAGAVSALSSTRQFKRLAKANSYTAEHLGNVDDYWNYDISNNTNNNVAVVNTPITGKENEVSSFQETAKNKKTMISNSNNIDGKKKKKGLSVIPNHNSESNIANVDDESNRESSSSVPLSKSTLPPSESKSMTIAGHKRKRNQHNFVVLTTCIDEDKQTIANFNKQFLAKSKNSNKMAFTSFDEIFQYFLTLHPNEISTASHFTDAVTHVVVSVGRNDSSSCSSSSTNPSSLVMKTRTMKYMQALAHGLWVVSTQWIYESILASLDANSYEQSKTLQQDTVDMLLLSEDAYEVKNNVKALIPRAPMRARQAKLSKKMPGLFAGYVVLLFGLFPMPGPARSDLEDLLVHTGVTRCFTQMNSFWEYYRSLLRESFDQFHQGAVDKDGSKSDCDEDYPTIVVVRSKDVMFASREEAIAMDVECILGGDVSESVIDTYRQLSDHPKKISPNKTTASSSNREKKQCQMNEAVLNSEDNENGDSNSADNLKLLEQKRLLKYFSTFPQVTALWVMDTITNFQMQPFVQYTCQNHALGNSKQSATLSKKKNLPIASNSSDKKVKRSIR